jgi:TonB family protein
MKNLLLGLVLLFPFLSIAQTNPIYEAHEVDSVAIPRGGYSYLTTFINANLQIPYMAKVAKVNGTVTLSGVVDEQGKISNVEVIRGLRPDCDKEAVRVFSLFNAWQSALKGGQKVVQRVSFRVQFKSLEDIVFKDGVRLEYFDSSFMPTKDSSAYRYVQKTPMDTLTGLPNEDINFFEIGKKDGKEYFISSFAQKIDKKYPYHITYPEALIDSNLQTYNVRHQTQEVNTIGFSINFFSNGMPQSKHFFMGGKPTHLEIKYYSNGMVRETTENIDIQKDSYKTTRWYPNGQIFSVTQYQKPLNVDGKKDAVGYQPHETLYVSQWDIDGNQVVVNGEGDGFSKHYDNKGQTYSEKGKIANFRKDGVWIEKFEDFAVINREIYKNGVFVKGISYSSPKDSVTYTAIEERPEFRGGMEGFTQFLTNNLRYPVDAQKYNVQGKCYIQFVVCTDGTLCDYEVLKSAGDSSLDKEALRVIKKSSGLWKPGLQRGQKVRSRFTIPINFSLGR